MARMSRGRSRIEIRRIEDPSRLRVTFSKRKGGIFSKASELCTLCGAEIAVIVFSPTSGKVYTFGHPDLNMVIDNFLYNQANSPARRSLKAWQDARAQEANFKLMELRSTMAAEKRFVSELNRIREQRPKNWWDVPVAELRLEQLQSLKNGLAQLKQSVSMQAKKLVMLQKILQDRRILQEEMVRRNRAVAGPSSMPRIW